MNEIGVQDEKPGFAERLKAVRGRLGLRQIDVARELDLRRETVALIEVDHVASAFVREKVRAWLEAREAEIAAMDAAAAAAAARAASAPSAAAGPRPRRRRRPPFNPLLATVELQRRAAQEQRAAEAAWRRRQAGRPVSPLRLLLLRSRRRRPLPIT